MKKFISLTLASLLTVVIMGMSLTGCANNDSSGKTTTTTESVSDSTTQPTTPTTNSIDLTPSAISDKIIEKTFENSIYPLDKEMVESVYGLDLSKIESYSISMPMINVKCDELAIIKVKDAADIEDVKTKLETRHKAILATWQQYLPEQYEIAKEAKIVTNGTYLMLVVTEKAEKAVEMFNSLLS